MIRGTNLPAVGGFNQSVILDLIRRVPEGLSRVEIAERTGLSPQTISNVVRRLLDAKVIHEVGKQISGPGKPRVILQLVPQSRYTVGIHLDPTVITYVVLDLRGDLIADMRVKTPDAASPTHVVGSMARDVNQIIGISGVDRSRLLGIGIASPGPIDSVLGVVVDPPLLTGWRNVPLRDALAQETGMPVLLEKDVIAAAVAEMWTTRDGHRGKDFAFFYLGTGIGVGLVLAGEVLRGTSGNAGEGGTLVVPTAGLPQKRRSEMLGHLATPQFLVEQAIDEGVMAGAPTHDLAAIDEAFSELVRIAMIGNEGALRLLNRAAGFVATAIVSIVNLLDIDEVVFGGPAWERVAPLFRPAIERAMNESPDRVTRHAVRLRGSSIGDDVAAVGAACLILDATLSPRASSLLISG